MPQKDQNLFDAMRGQKAISFDNTLEIDTWQFECHYCGWLSSRKRIKIAVHSFRRCERCGKVNRVQPHQIIKKKGEVELGTRRLK